ncbi:MAG: helix-turn-helix domain-containing protein [Patescibacteria group bacterium]
MITYDISYVMPHLSKRKIHKKYFDKLISELLRSLERSFKNGKTKSVFYEFFTYTERAMFAKRLAVIAMLSQNISTYTIAETLCMSPSTVDKMSLRFERGKYNEIIKYALGSKDIWGIIENIVTAGGFMPPRVGGRRWKKFDKYLYDKKLLET